MVADRIQVATHTLVRHSLTPHRRATADRHAVALLAQFSGGRQRAVVTKEEVGKRVVHEKRRVVKQCQTQLAAEQLLMPVPSKPAARIDSALRHLSCGLRGSGLHSQVSEFLDLVLVERPHGGRSPAEEALQDVEDRDGGCADSLLGIAHHTRQYLKPVTHRGGGRAERPCSPTLHTLLFSIPPLVKCPRGCYSPMQAHCLRRSRRMGIDVRKQ